MVSEKGIVEEILPDNRVLVRIEKRSACDHCEYRHHCNFILDESMHVKVRNDFGAAAGDLVELSVSSRSFLGASILVYILPVVALLIGAYAGGYGAGLVDSDMTLGAVAGGGGAMGAAFWVLRRLDKGPGVGRFSPRMTRVLASSPGCGDSR